MGEVTQKIFINAREVASLLELKNAMAFQVRRVRLESEGFPRPSKISKTPRRWRRAEVLQWLELADATTGPEPDPAPIFRHAEFVPEMLPQMLMIQRKAQVA
jgi:predicted DNA-binding transcriptional regulator AlpA